MIRFDSWKHPRHTELVVEGPLSKEIGSIGIPSASYNCCSLCSCLCSCLCSFLCLNIKCCANETRFFIYDTSNIKYTVEKQVKCCDCCCSSDITTYNVFINFIKIKIFYLNKQVSDKVFRVRKFSKQFC